MSQKTPSDLDAKRAAKREYMRQFYAKNPDYRTKASRKWREKHPDYNREYCSAWRRANRDRALKRSARWRAANPNYNKEYLRAWRSANPNRWRAYWRLYERIRPIFIPAADAAVREGITIQAVYRRVREGKVKAVRRSGKLHVSTRDLTPESQKRKLPASMPRSISLDSAPVFLAEGASSHDRIADPRAVNPLDAVIEQETLAEMWPLFEWLEAEVSEQDRAVLLAYAEHGFDERLAADTLGMHLQTAQAAIRRVRRSVPANVATLFGEADGC